MISVSLFIVSTIAFFVLLLLFPKREERINAAEWSIVMLMSLFGIWAFLAGCINLLKIPINLVSISGINLCGILLLGIGFAKLRKIQKFYIRWYDILVLLLLIGVTLGIGFSRYGTNLGVFAYESDDSVRHFSNAKYVVMSGYFGNSRYVMDLLDMISISVLKAFTGRLEYQAFLAADMILLFMQGGMFWALVRRYLKTPFHICSAILLTLFYLCGYPLNNMLHGFEYLGMALLMASYLVWVIWENDYKKLPSWQYIFAIAVANAGIFLSYTQFAPAVLCGEMGYFIFSLREKRNQRPLTFLAMLVAGIGIPGILCVQYVMPSAWLQVRWIVYIGLLLLTVCVSVSCGLLYWKAKKKQTSIRQEYIKILQVIAHQKKDVLIIGLVVVVAIIGVLAYKYVYVGLMMRYAADSLLVLDGSIYREPYANYLLLAFPAILYVCDCWKKKQNDIAIWMALGVILESVWLIRYIYIGVIGTYYLYKMCFLMWLMLFAMAARCLLMVGGERLKMLQVYLVMVLVFAVSVLSRWEERLTEHNRYLWPESTGKKLLGVYLYNQNLMAHGGNVNQEMQDMYNKIGDLVLATGEHIPYFGDDARYRREYYYYLSNQHPDSYVAEWNVGEDDEDIIQTLKAFNIQHIFVADDYIGSYAETFSKMPVYYATAYGRLIELK